MFDQYFALYLTSSFSLSLSFSVQLSHFEYYGLYEIQIIVEKGGKICLK